jgi:hypothetical protein
MGYYLINIGPHHLNQSGNASRGYWIRRQGNTVRRTWGAVDVVGARGGRYYWHGRPQEHIDCCPSVAEAVELVDRMLHEKQTHASRGIYTLLERPNKIHRRRR